jgi:hypothetical protein
MNSGAAFRLAQALGGRPDGRRSFICRCPNPLHGRGLGDRNPSLRIYENADGELEIVCLAGCREDNVRRHAERVAARHRISIPARAS